MIFRARQFEFRFPRPALVMGIVNVTPDSFSDGGLFFDSRKAVQHALDLIDQGADILDIGGESTRPGATPVDEREELRRVIPVFKKLAGQAGVPLSIDTMKPAVARAALEAGASIVNDVAAHRQDREMWKCVSDYRAGYVCMHSCKLPGQARAVPEVATFFSERLAKLTLAGVTPEQVVLDVGIGFGKTLSQNLQLLADLRSFTKLKRPVLEGETR